jgi:2-methylcitrate dehydratase PrpD
MDNFKREYTRELIAFLHRLQPRDLPGEVLDRARYFLLDYLSVAIRGSREAPAKAVQRMIQKAIPSTPENRRATVLGTPLKTLPSFAAFANGASSHGIEQDDTHSGGSIHLGTTMYSVALALAETCDGVTSDALLAAVVAGYEAAARIAMAVQPQQQYALGFHPTQTCGVFGATVTACKLLQLSEEQTLHAAGIAGSMSAGSMEFLAEGAWTKKIHPGLAAQNGIHAALLAAEGFSGPAHILEGRDGFLHAYSRDAIAERLTANLGKTYEILHTAVKPHSCCRYMQGPIDAVLDIVRQETFQPERIRNIEIAVLNAGWGIVAEPREQKYNPQSVVDAQFSMPFGAAVAAVRGAAGLDQFTLEQIFSPEVRAMMQKVTLVKDPLIEETYPREWPARVTIETTDEQRHERFVRYPKGDPENPLTWDEMAAKFHALAGAVLPKERCDEIIAQVASPEGPANVARLCAVEKAAALA